MPYKIADLLTQIPTAGSLASRCQAYYVESDETPDITIESGLYRREVYPPYFSEDDVEYMESATQFYNQLLEFNGTYLHASAVALNGQAYLFSGPSGIGKSTHTRLWQNNLGSAVQVFNDDKPVLRLIDGVWYAYGTPWCGKDHINLNQKVKLAGICFLKQAEHNRIRTLCREEAIQKLWPQTSHRFKFIKNLDKMLELVEQLIEKVPFYELENRPEPDAAWLSYQVMCCGKKGDLL